MPEEPAWHLADSRLLVQGLCLHVHLGVSEAERARPQRLLISLEIEVEPAVARDEEIASVVDYGQVVQGLRRLATRRTQLLETWAKWIAEICLADSRVRGARITLLKPDVYDDGVEVGIRQSVARS